MFVPAPPWSVRRPGLYGASLPARHRVSRVVALALWSCLLLMLPAADAFARALRIVAFGDSLTAGYGLPQASSFPAVLEKALKARGHDVEIVNAGVSGDTATGGLQRLDWSVSGKVDGVILELGANDMLRGVDPAVTRRALDAIVTRLKARAIPVLLAGMYAARNLGPDYVARFEAIYADLSREHAIPLYPFFMDGVAGRSDLSLPDGLHPSAAGVSIVVERILPTVERFLATLKP